MKYLLLLLPILLVGCTQKDECALLHDDLGGVTGFSCLGDDIPKK